TSITVQPANPTNSTSASFSFTGSDNVTPGGSLTFQCDLDGGGFSACTSPKSYAALSEASHTFQVKATDQAGNTDATPAGYTWTIDSTSPITALVTTPVDGAANQAGSVPASFGGSIADNGGGVGMNANSTTFTLQRGSDDQYWNGSGWQAAVANLATTHGATIGSTAATWTDNVVLPAWSSEAAGAYTVQAKATDKAANTFTGSAVTFTLLANAPPSLGTAA